MKTYKEKWNFYRRKNRFVTIVLIAGLPSIILFSMLIRWLFGLEMTLVFPLLSACWAVYWGYLAFKLIRFPCPRCGEAFLLNQKPEIQASRKCPNCGLKLYEEPEQGRHD